MIKGVSVVVVPKSRSKLRGSHKIAIIAAILGGGGYFGWQAYSANVVDNKVFPELKPGDFSIIGIATGRSFKIIVSNQIAQLVELTGSDEFDPGDITATTEQGTNKKRVPLRDLLKTLQGDSEALGRLVTEMNDPLREADMPGTEVNWSASDIQKALAGDSLLKKKLQSDLNVDLEGNPLDQVSPSALRNGIVINSFVPIKVSVEGKATVMKAPIKLPFRSFFSIDVEKGYENDLEPTREQIVGHYLEVAKRLDDRPSERQNIADALRQRVDEANLQRLYATGPERVLGNARVIITEKQIASADLSENTTRPNLQLWDLALNLTPEGRDRLWQFSRRGNVGSQLLVIHNGVAIAAPSIRHELAQSQVVIRQLPEKGLAQETVDFLNGKVNK